MDKGVRNKSSVNWTRYPMAAAPVARPAILNSGATCQRQRK
jgi:hypothetical protein